MCKRVLMIFMISLFFVSGVYAFNFTADSCSATDIDSAIDYVLNQGGGTVFLPECDETYSPLKNFHIPWGVSLEGAGKEKTILREAVFTARNYGFVGDYITRIGKISVYNGIPELSESSRPYSLFRNDYPEIYNTTFILYDMNIEGRFSTFCITTKTRGLVYNTKFNLFTSYGFYIHGDDSYFDNIYTKDCANTFGTLDKFTVVLEDNNWTGFYDHLMDSRTGGSYIFRNNNVTYTIDGAGPIETHGPTHDGDYRNPTNSGGNRFEIYDNLISNSFDVTSSSSGIFLRGGCWLVYNNTLKDKRIGIMMQIETSPSWPCSEDLYPIYNQPKDIWIFNNTFKSILEKNISVSSESSPCIQENRDYFLRAPSLEEDNFEYTPYPYPHPLRLEDQKNRYYVSPLGKDSNPGTEEQPWLTIQKCADTINGGDTCIVKNGTYPERVIISRSGFIDNPIRIVSENKHGATVIGAYSQRTNCGESMTWGPFCIQGNHIELDGFNIDQSFSPSYYNKGVEIVGTNIKIKNFNIRVYGFGIYITGSGNTARDNYIYGSDFGIQVSGSNNLVENNTIYSPKYNGASNDVDYIRFFGSSHTFRGNILYGCNVSQAVSDIGAHVDCFQTWEFSSGTLSDILIEGNYCANAHTGFQMRSTIPGTTSSGIFVRNNIIDGLALGYSIDNIGHTHGYKNMRFYNNHFLVKGFLRIDDGATADVKNNIFYGSVFPNIPYYFAGGAKQISGTESRNNLIYTQGRTFTDYPNNIINAAPIFLDINKGNYILTYNSRGVDEGFAITSDIWGLPKDYLGVSRPKGITWDIGAYEYIPLETCSHPAEQGTPDCIISLNELTAYVNSWKSDLSISINSVMDAISKWKAGGYS